MAYPYPTVSSRIPCPNCRAPVDVAIQQIVDLGHAPAMRDALLQGELNALRCAACGASGAVAVPLLYHDPAHEMLLAYVPNEMQLRLEDEEKEIGRLSNALMDQTPAEQRRGYMITPTRVMSYEGLVEKIMEAEGVDPNEIRAQTAKIQIVLDMARVVGDDEALNRLIDQHQDQVDYQFMLLVTMTLQQSAESGDEATAELYRQLRERLIERLSLDAELIPPLTQDEAVDALIERLLEMTPEERGPLVAANRPLLDYGFFMRLTEQLEGSEDEARTSALAALRSQLVAITEEMDDNARQSIERAAQQLQELLGAQDLDTRLQEMEGELDEAFLVVLSANLEQARQSGEEEIAALFERIFQQVVKMQEKRLRPELRAVNQLLQMDSADERRVRLREELGRYNPAGFIEMLEAIADDLEASGRAHPQVLERLHLIADEAKALTESEFEGRFVPPSGPIFEEGRSASGTVLRPKDAQRADGEEPPTLILP